MSLMLNFCRSVPPEFLRSFLRWEGVAASIAFDDQCPVSRSAGSCKQHYQQPKPKLARLATLSLGLARCSYRQQNYQQPQQINNKNSANNHNCLALALARVNNQN